MNLEKIIRDYLSDVVHMSLGTSKDGQPWVCEVHFAYDDELNLYFRSLTSRRHSQEIATNPKVAGNIVRQHMPDTWPPLGVYFEGTASYLTSEEDRKKAYQAVNKRFNLGDKILKESEDPDGHQFYKVAVNNWYIFGSLKEGKGPLKYKLTWPS